VSQALHFAQANLTNDEKKTPAEMRSKIVQLENAMKAMPGALTAADFVTLHHFAPGVYMRELRIPKGVTLTGKIHKTEHLNILSQGRLAVWTEDGMKVLDASTVVLSQPGIKRVGHALEDSVWITVHQNPTEEKNPDTLEEMLVVDTFEQLESFLKEQKQLTTQGGEKL